jgi:hypothetical protein
MPTANPTMPRWWPTCGHCGGLVDRFAWTADPAVPKTLTLRVDCHGTAETTVWPRQAAGNAFSVQPFAKRTASA